MKLPASIYRVSTNFVKIFCGLPISRRGLHLPVMGSPAQSLSRRALLAAKAELLLTHATGTSVRGMSGACFILKKMVANSRSSPYLAHNHILRGIFSFCIGAQHVLLQPKCDANNFKYLTTDTHLRYSNPLQLGRGRNCVSDPALLG